jgi:PAS domain-containing protein
MNSTEGASTPAVLTSDTMLDRIPLGVCRIDRELRVLAWNATLAAWTGIPRESALGMSLLEKYPRLATWCFRERLAQVFSSGTPAIFSAAFHRYFIPVNSSHDNQTCEMIQHTVVRPIDERHEEAIVTIQDVTAQYLQLGELRRRRCTLTAPVGSLRDSPS